MINYTVLLSRYWIKVSVLIEIEIKNIYSGCRQIRKSSSKLHKKSVKFMMVNKYLKNVFFKYVKLNTLLVRSRGLVVRSWWVRISPYIVWMLAKLAKILKRKIIKVAYCGNQFFLNNKLLTIWKYNWLKSANFESFSITYKINQKIRTNLSQNVFFFISKSKTNFVRMFKKVSSEFLTIVFRIDYHVFTILNSKSIFW